MTNTTVVLLLLLFAALWALQMYAGGRQVQRFMRAVRAIRVQGRTAIGTAGGRVGGRTYVAVAADASDRVVAATRLSGRTVFAGPQPMDRIVGRQLQELLDPGDELAARAAADAARHLLRDEGDDETDDETRGQDVAARDPT